MADELIGKYKVLRKIGAGGMASVFLATHCDVPSLKTVLKKLSDPQLADRFKREADKLAMLDGHSGICQIKHFFEHDNDFYIVMEYIDGPTLDELVKSDDPPDLASALKITRSILTTLDYAHRQGIVHRDIKPTNIMIDRMDQVKIIDFGVAKGATDPDLTQVGTSLGSPRYMAPEQFNPQGPVDWVRSDLYAVGITLYYLLTRTLPFQGSSIYEICEAKQRGDVPPPSQYNPAVPPAVDAVVLRAMARDPGARFATAAEMRTALQGLEATGAAPVAAGSDRTMVLGGGESSPESATMDLKPAQTAPPARESRPSPASAGKTPAPNRRRIIIVAAAVVLAGVVGTIAVLSLRSGDEPVPTEPVAKPLPVAPPVLLAPATGAVLKDARVEFRWDAAGDSLGVFTLQYGTDAEFARASQSAEHRGDRYRVGEQLGAGVYYWRVRRGPASLPGGPWSTVNSFTIAAAPAVQPPKTTTPVRPRPTVTTFEMRFGVSLDGVPVMDDAVLIVDGARQDFYFPGTFDLTAGEHEITAVYIYEGMAWKATRTIKVTATSERTLIFALQKSN